MRNRQLVVPLAHEHTHAVQERWRDGKTFYVVTTSTASMTASAAAAGSAADQEPGRFRGRQGVRSTRTGRTSTPRCGTRSWRASSAWNLPSYTGFVMPAPEPVHGSDGRIANVRILLPPRLHAPDAGVRGQGAGVTPSLPVPAASAARVAALSCWCPRGARRTAWISDGRADFPETVMNVTQATADVNVGRAVQTFTHPLWLALLTASYLVVRNVVLRRLRVSMAVSLWVFWLAVSRAKTTWQAVGGAAALLSSRAFTDYSTSGLENPLVNLLLRSAFVACSCARAGRRAGRSASSGACVAGSTWPARTRSDRGALLLRRRSRARGARVVARSARSGCYRPAWTAFAIVYYGFPFPNTAYAKLGMDISTAKSGSRASSTSSTRSIAIRSRPC